MWLLTPLLPPLSPILPSTIWSLFFWVLLYICLTRCGPGGYRRKELSNGWPLNTMEDKRLASVVFCLFGGDRPTLRVNKNLLLDQ